MTTYFYSDTGSDFSGYREKIELLLVIVAKF